MTQDTTVKKVSSEHSPKGAQGQVYLVSGKRVSMRLWRDEAPTQDKPSHKHEYEVVGYVISGRAELEIEGQTIRLEPGDSWLVPPNAEGSVRARANKYRLSWDEPIQGHAACKMASTVAVLRRWRSLRPSAGTDWLWRQ
jgi:quercetin dioxygenase-like cupin family protein